jgi:ABC-type nickel/cobalt efflux system permease component RcnA
MSILFAGLLAGFLHVLAGPDHLAAVAPYAGAGRARAWRLGVRWGLGHASGVALVGLLSLLLREVLPLDALSAWSERAVGVVLIGIGLWGLHAALRKRLHTHAHDHDGEPHAHVHFHTPGIAHEDARAHRHGHAALAVGTLHGLAGSSHLLGILPALALPTRAAAVLYLLAFGMGTIAAMASFSSFIGLLGARAAVRGPSLYRSFLGLCSAAAIAVGGFWLFH